MNPILKEKVEKILHEMEAKIHTDSQFLKKIGEPSGHS
jgi:hypothetical protein